MAASLITVLFLFFCLLQSADLQLQPIKEITVRPGDDVTLPCEAPNNVNISAVEWSRSNLEKHVYLKSDGRLNTADQDPSYLNRVQLKDDEMKNGELSLILNNVNSNDGGTYECHYVEERGGAHQMEPISIVYLDVRDPQEQPITVQRGDDVTLPCRAPNNVIIALVEWSRSGLNRSNPDKHVYLKRDGHLETEDQDPSYVNRVQLKDDEMKNGELSLILKNVNSNDEGRYECRYVEKTGGRKKRALIDGKPISIVYLKVTDGDSEDGKDTDGTEGGLLGVILTVTLIVSALVGFMIFKKLKGRSENNPDLPVDDPDVHQPLQENVYSQINITQNISDTQM